MCKEWTETDKWMYQQFIKWNNYSDVKCNPQCGLGNYTSCAQGRNMSHKERRNMKFSTQCSLVKFKTSEATHADTNNECDNKMEIHCTNSESN